MIIHNPRFVTSTGPDHVTGVQDHDHERDCRPVVLDEAADAAYADSPHAFEVPTYGGRCVICGRSRFDTWRGHRTDSAMMRERTLTEYRAAMAEDDEPCRCGHPESAHTELGCGAESVLVWDMTYGPGPCTCEAFHDQEPEEPR